MNGYVHYSLLFPGSLFYNQIKLYPERDMLAELSLDQDSQYLFEKHITLHVLRFSTFQLKVSITPKIVNT